MSLNKFLFGGGISGPLKSIANIRFVQPGQTVQDVLNSIVDASQTNPYFVIVPPTRERPAYIPKDHVYIYNTNPCDFYVDATNGDDNNDGTIDAPFKTVAKINSLGLLPGDRVLFKCNEEWMEELTISYRGTKEQPIVFTSYGAGYLPTITGLTTTDSSQWESYDGKYRYPYSSPAPNVLVEDGVYMFQRSPNYDDPINRVTNAGDWARTDGYIYFIPTSGTPSNHVIRIGRLNRPVYFNQAKYIIWDGINVEGCNHIGTYITEMACFLVQDCEHIEIKNSHVAYSQWCGLSVLGSKHIKIFNISANFVDYRGISIGADCENVKIKNCFETNIGYNAHEGWDEPYIKADMEAIAISAWSCDDSKYSKNPTKVYIRDNFIENCGHTHAYDPSRGKGIVINEAKFDNDVEIIIEKNLVRKCFSAGIKVESTGGNVKMVDNITVENGWGNSVYVTNSWKKMGGIIVQAKDGQTLNVIIANNLSAYNECHNTNGYSGNLVISANNATVNAIVKNNILSVFKTVSNTQCNFNIVNPNGGTVNLTSDYNCFWEASDTTVCINYLGTTYDRAHVKGSSNGYWSYDTGNDNNSIVSDPCLVRLGNGKFALRHDSPCIEAGVYIAGITKKLNPNIAPSYLETIKERRGTATITSGNTYVDVTHNLNETPNIEDIIVTPMNNLGSATKFWISNVTSTTFRINVDTDPGASGASFVWQIKR